MKLNDENFTIQYENNSKTIFFSGILRLWDPNKYNDIKNFLLDVYGLDSDQLTLNFKDLEFLNSSGISTLCKFIIEAKKLGQKPIRVVGNHDLLWQTKSLANLKALWNKVDVEFD